MILLDLNGLKVILKNLQKQPPEVFYKKGAPRNFAKFTGKHLCQSLFFNEVAGRRPQAKLMQGLNLFLFVKIFPTDA